MVIARIENSSNVPQGVEVVGSIQLEDERRNGMKSRNRVGPTCLVDGSIR
jgi:hypothetical protein